MVWEMGAQRDKLFPQVAWGPGGRTVFGMPSLSPVSAPAEPRLAAEASVVTQRSGLD